jgi:hypothetical protein
LKAAIRQADTPSPIKHASDRQVADALADSEDRGTSGGNQQQSGFDAASAEAVEQHPQWQLRRGESEKVGAGQQPQAAGTPGPVRR